LDRPAYLKPLPTWLQLVIAAVGVGLVTAIAIFSRRRASRPDNLA
jgi:hypothetical protein